jgi:acetolactate synthase-1/2/3 large subunit
MLGMHGTYEANMAMHNSDLVLAVGARFSDRVTNNVAKFCPNAKIIHIDIDPASISKTVRVDIPIVGSIDKVIPQMMDVIDELGLNFDRAQLVPWWNQIAEYRAKKCLDYKKGEYLVPQQVIEALRKYTNENTIIASDVGQHQMFTALYYPFKKPRKWLNSGGLGTMGYGFPAAVGAQMANPDETVVCISSDGSFQMNIQELSTCLEYNIPLKILIINNYSLGMVKQWQKLFYEGRTTASYSQEYVNSLPDFVKLAEAYGHVGMRIEKPEELDSTLEKAFAMKDKLVLIDILVDPDAKVYPMQIAKGAMCDMRLSDTENTVQ